jgi:hypothetical protein
MLPTSQAIFMARAFAAQQRDARRFELAIGDAMRESLRRKHIPIALAPLPQPAEVIPFRQPLRSTCGGPKLFGGDCA